MKITLIDPKKLKPFSKNPRINKDAVDAVKESIKEFGFNQPIVVNKDNIIFAGHTRWIAAKKLKLKKVPVLVKSISLKKMKAYLLADNKTHELSTWDDPVLGDLLRDLGQEDKSLLNFTGFSEKELDGFMTPPEIEFEEKNKDKKKSESKPILKKKDAQTEEMKEIRKEASRKISDLRVMQLFLDDITFPAFVEMVDNLQTELGTSSVSDTVYCAVEKVYNETR